MKKFFLSCSVLLIATIIFAQDFTVSDNGSTVKFGIKNLGSTVKGSFTGVSGTVNFNPANLGASNFNVTVNANTVFTDNSARDKHLRKEDYFNVAQYPTMSFVSTKITATNTANTFNIEGKITIKGVSKNISFPFTAIKQGKGYLFSGNFNLNRIDFKVGSKSWILSDNLLASLILNAQKN
jgi:polyisoprenoid-binding protein YceI